MGLQSYSELSDEQEESEETDKLVVVRTFKRRLVPTVVNL